MTEDQQKKQHMLDLIDEPIPRAYHDTHPGWFGLDKTVRPLILRFHEDEYRFTVNRVSDGYIEIRLYKQEQSE